MVDWVRARVGVRTDIPPQETVDVAITAKFPSITQSLPCVVRETSEEHGTNHQAGAE
jgi:hypothetical protein